MAPDIFRCPLCRAGLERSTDPQETAACSSGADPLRDSALQCTACDQRFPVRDGIPHLLVTDNETTEKIRSFYEEVPFPNYDEFDDAATLMDRSRDGMLARLLDEQVPLGTRVLEAGCGTGQLSNFLAIGNRQVYGADLSLASLKLAHAFKIANNLNRVRFLQMNLFEPCFAEQSFDVVVSNGVLHHTQDPARAIGVLAQLLKPGGHLVVGLYHAYGRMATDIRRHILRLAGPHWKGLDRRHVDESLSPARRDAWFRDQYQNPHETKHTIRQAAHWLEAAGLRYVRSLPSRRWQVDPDEYPELFRAEAASRPVSGWLKEASLALRPSQIREGGFFVVIGQLPETVHD